MMKNRTEPLATLDFVSGGVTLFASSGFISVNDLDHLATAVESISACACELQRLVGDPDLAHTNNRAPKEATGRSHEFLTFARDDFEVKIVSGANVERFIKQITSRRAELQDVLQQAAEIGSRITRRPYAEYIDAIKKTGLCQVESHGFAILVDGRLLFKPKYQVLFVRPHGPDLFEVHTLGDFNVKRHEN
jgi:hypothetical protein